MDLDVFYRETDRQARERWLEEHLTAGPETSQGPDPAGDPEAAEAEAARRVFCLRFGREEQADMFLRSMLELLYIARATGVFLSPDQKNAERALIRMGFGEAGMLGGKEPEDRHLQNALYREIGNAARCYLMTCRSEDYSRRFFGLLKSDDADKEKKALEDLLDMSVRCTNRICAGKGEKMREAMQFFSESVREAYAGTDETAASRWEKAAAKRTR